MKYKSKKKPERALACLLAVLLVFSLTACESYKAFKAAFIDPPPKIESFKIGILEPLTGADAEGAKAELEGIELAFENFPNIGGVPVELVYGDNQSDVSVCASAAQNLIDAGCKFIIGSYKSVLTLAASDIIKEARIPAISVTNTNPIITSTNNWYFRVCYIDSYEGKAAADFVLNSLNTSSAAILTIEGNDYAQAMADEFKAAMGNDDIPQIKITKDDPDYYSYYMMLDLYKPDVVFFPSSLANGAERIAQSREEGFNFKFLGTKNWNGITEDDVYYTMDFDPKAKISEVTQIFRNAYAEKFGKEKTPSDAAALGFDAYLLVREAVNKVGTDATNFDYRRALSEIDGMQGATGIFTMDGSGDPIKDILIEHFKDGDFSAVYTVEPERSSRTEEETQPDGSDTKKN